MSRLLLEMVILCILVMVLYPVFLGILLLTISCITLAVQFIWNAILKLFTGRK